MMAVILSSGSCPLHGTDTLGRVAEKPKCLYHVDGEVLLERQVRMLRKHGIQQIRVVVGYKKELIEQFNEDKKLDLELFYNPNWKKCADETLKIGVKSVDDDLLLVCGDSYFSEQFLETFLAVKNSVAVTGRPGHGLNLSKVAKSELKIFEDYDRCCEKYRSQGYSEGELLMRALSDLFERCQAFFFPEPKSGEDDYANFAQTFKGEGVWDIDFMEETDEGKPEV